MCCCDCCVHRFRLYKIIMHLLLCWLAGEKRKKFKAFTFGSELKASPLIHFFICSTLSFYGFLKMFQFQTYLFVLQVRGYFTSLAVCFLVLFRRNAFNAVQPFHSIFILFPLFPFEFIQRLCFGAYHYINTTSIVVQQWRFFFFHLYFLL